MLRLPESMNAAIQLGLREFRTPDSPDLVEALSVEFQRNSAFQVTGFLSTDLIEFVRRRIHDADFIPREHGAIGTELSVDGHANIAVQTLLLRMNDRALVSFIERVTGISPLMRFDGRLYRMTSGAGHHDNWHNDVGAGRLLGVSINLSPQPHEGGTFIIRPRGVGESGRPMPNLGLGDANFFRISPGLEHMVTRVEGPQDKTAFAGWFHKSGSIPDLLRPR